MFGVSQNNMLEPKTITNILEGFAGVAQLVEHHLAKVDVEGSNPFARSIKIFSRYLGKHPYCTQVYHGTVFLIL